MRWGTYVTVSQICGYSATKKINHEVVNNWICSYSFLSKDASGIWTFFHIWQSQTHSLWEYASLTGQFIAIAYLLGHYRLFKQRGEKPCICHLFKKKKKMQPASCHEKIQLSEFMLAFLKHIYIYNYRMLDRVYSQHHLWNDWKCFANNSSLSFSPHTESRQRLFILSSIAV